MGLPRQGTTRIRTFLLCAAAIGSVMPVRGEPRPLDVQVELVAEGMAGGIHGWHSSRLLMHDGILYASALLSGPPETPPDKPFQNPTCFFQRRDGRWTMLSKPVPFNLYTMLIGPDGRFWAVGNHGYADCTVYRSRVPLDPSTFEPLYTGTCAYLGASISPEGNFLIMHAESPDFTAFKPNAVIAAFYDCATAKWYTSRLETPEGRYGYIGIVLRGRRAIAVLNSALSDPKANPDPPHYSWRHVRLVACDDLTRGQWRNTAWLMPQYGDTWLNDMILAPDGQVYLSYSYREGGTVEEARAKPMEHYIARLHDDATAEVFPTGLTQLAATRVFVSSQGRWFLLARAGGDPVLRLWELEPPPSLKPMREYTLPGTEVLQGYVIHTLRPERFGGQADGDTVHLYTASFHPRQDNPTAPENRFWHVSFRLPPE